MESDRIIISSSETGHRLDKVLANRFSGSQSRTYFQSLIEKGLVLVNGELVKKRVQMKVDDEVEIYFTHAPEIKLQAEPMDLSIIYEDEDLIVLNKPANCVVHPAVGNWSGTLVNGLLHHCRDLMSLDESLRPGIVHRLDKDTTGVIVAAKNSLTQRRLVELFAARVVRKEYLVICCGNPGNLTIDAPIGRHPVQRQMMAVVETGKPAITHCQVQSWDGKLSVVRALIETGRTHQIRVHLKHMRAPVLGDMLYGNDSMNKKYGVVRQMLHAHRLSFKHPRTEKIMEFMAPLPDDMKGIVDRIG